MEKASETLYGLTPVTFHYKKEVDPRQALSFGLIAEDVAKVDPDLVTQDQKGEPETVRYEAVNAMLLNQKCLNPASFTYEKAFAARTGVEPVHQP